MEPPGLIAFLLIGVIGAVIGGHVFRFLGLAAGGFTGAPITASVGAVPLLSGVRLLKQT